MEHLSNESEHPTPTDALDDLTDLHGWTPWFSLDHQEHYGEIMAHCSAAPAFVNAMIEQAEPLHQAGNRHGVRAAMIETHCWMTRMTDAFAWEHMPEEEQQNSGLRRGLDRLHEAAQRYAPLLTDTDPTDDPALMALWRAALAPAGLAAALDHHVTRLNEETNAFVQEGHNAAIRVTVTTLEYAAKHLQEVRSVKTTGPRPSNRQMQRCLGQVAAAISRCQEISDLMDRTVPITLNEDVATDDRLAQPSRELGQHLREAESDYAIMENADEPEDSLIAYRNHSGIRVKRVIDNYEDYTTEEAAVSHAASFMAIADEMVEAGTDNAIAFHKLASMVYDNAVAGLHDIDRLEFGLLMDQLRDINDDPTAVREAAMTALSDEHAGADLLLAMSDPEENPVSIEQALTVIKAGRNSGMSEGHLRALAAAMGYQPSQLDVQPPQASAQDMMDALDACPEPLSLHQMLRIVQAMGGDPSDQAIVAWAQENCHDTFEHDVTAED